jgi:hypothetical protein
MRRVVKSHDVKAVFVRPNPHGTRLLSDPANDLFWAEAQELDCTIAIHSAVFGDMPTAGFDRYHDFFQRMIISHPLEQQMGKSQVVLSSLPSGPPRSRPEDHACRV